MEKLKVRLTITHLGCLLEHKFSFVEVSGNAMALHIEDTHPMSTNKTPLLSTHVVVAGSFFLVCFISGLCVCKFSDGIASTTAATRSFCNDSLEPLHDLFQVRLSIEANVVICFIFDRWNMPIFGSSLKPVDSLGLIFGNFLWADTLYDKSTEHVACIICPLRLTRDDSLKFRLS